ncbi:Clp protease N-terminal domain-containing protein [Kitasatospora sp. NPDC057692]|uniref:Clp protease N-terminal domain-containing protein n=1 Tax=Kitasatospora sp. NPDC057692 TaxID=3346215 RepID=UPI0036A49AA8
MFERFGDHARRVVLLAREEARELNYHRIGTEHLLLGLLHEEQGAAGQVLRALGLSLEGTRKQVVAVSRPAFVPALGHLQYTPRATAVLDRSRAVATGQRHHEVGTEHLLLALLDEGEGGGTRTLAALGLDSARVFQEVVRRSEARAPVAEPAVQDRVVQEAAVQKPAVQEPAALERTTRDLTREMADRSAATAVTALGRRPEIEWILRILARQTRNVPLLVGEPGVGKTSTVLGLARAVATGHVPHAFRDRTVRLLDVGELFTDPRHHGRFTEVIAELVGEVRRTAGLVLFLDNALATVHTREGRATALAFFRPVLGRPGTSVIAAATTADYQRWDRDAGLDRLIHLLAVNEPAPQEVLEILHGARHRLVAHHGVEITDAALASAARLARSHRPGQVLPGAAIDLLDEASAHVRAEPPPAGAPPAVTRAAVERTAAGAFASPHLSAVSPPVPHDPSVWSMS